jgi:hypothetical protein
VYFYRSRPALLRNTTRVWGLNYSRNKKFIYSTKKKKSPDQLRGPPTHLPSGYPGSFPRIEQPGHDVNNVPPSGAKVKNE